MWSECHSICQNCSKHLDFLQEFRDVDRVSKVVKMDHNQEMNPTIRKWLPFNISSCLCACKLKRIYALCFVKWPVQKLRTLTSKIKQVLRIYISLSLSMTGVDLLTPWHYGGYWLYIYILPAGSPGSYSLSHTGDAYLSLRSLNGEGLNITSSLHPQVCTEGSCRVGLNAVNPVNQFPWIPTISLAPFDLDLSLNPVLTSPLTPSNPHATQTCDSLHCTVNPEEDRFRFVWSYVCFTIKNCVTAFPSLITCTHSP